MNSVPNYTCIAAVNWFTCLLFKKSSYSSHTSKICIKSLKSYAVISCKLNFHSISGGHKIKRISLTTPCIFLNAIFIYLIRYKEIITNAKQTNSYKTNIPNVDATSTFRLKNYFGFYAETPNCVMLLLSNP